MAKATIPTLVSLDDFARVLGINPVHFAGAKTSSNSAWPNTKSCDQVWPQYDWQAEDVVSREEVAYQIGEAERSIANVLGYDIAPRWYSSDEQQWPNDHRIGRRSGHVSQRRHLHEFQTRRGYIINPGRRAASEIEIGATIVYSDEDGDSWKETATITVAAIGDESADEVQIFFAGNSADAAFQIRPVRSVTISGGNIVIVADSWLFIDPDLWEAYPGSFREIDISDPDVADCVATVDVYRIYNDTSQVSAELVWPPDPGCTGENCVEITQTGCMLVREPRKGSVSVRAATYADGSWLYDTQLNSYYDPDRVRFWYYGGYRSDDWLSGRKVPSIHLQFLKAVVFMAAARLDKPVCSCSQIAHTVDNLQQDLSQFTRDRRQFIPPQSHVHSNPFGTRVGEVKAWQIVERQTPDKIWGAVAL